MKKLKKIVGVIIGTLIIGIGVAFNKAAALGQDPLASFIFSFVYLCNEKIPYSVWYIIINFTFFVFMFVYLRNRINFGTIAGLLFIGIFSDIFYSIFITLNIIPETIIIRFIYMTLGILICCFGIAFYGSANLGLGPYDAVVVLISKKIKKLKFKHVRIILDTICAVIAFIISNIYLRRTDIVNINTILMFLFDGPLIAFFSKIVIKIYYKEDFDDFN